MSRDPRVLLIAWDAAEPRLVEQWIGDGTLPNLARLREQGAYGRLRSTADWFVGSPWPTFFSAALPNEHGVHHFLQWAPERMGCVRPSAEGRPLPFWHALGEAGRRSVVLDLPMTFAPRPFNGVELSGWATHDRFAEPASHPPPLLAALRREFGETSLAEEHYGADSVEQLLDLREELLASTAAVAQIAEALMRRESWSLFMLGLGATHRGGHKLWDPSSLVPAARAEDRSTLEAGLRDVYVACDQAVGQLVAAAPDDCAVLVCSLHGMGANTSRADILPAMIDRILSDGADSGAPEVQAPTSTPGLLRRLSDRIPDSWRLAVKHRLPMSLQDDLTARFFMGEIDFATAKAFCHIADLQGKLQVNLRGREKGGIVEPGAEFEDICERLITGLATFVDADTREPIVRDIRRSSEIYPGGARQHELPDLIVRWAQSPGSKHRAIVSERFGTVPWPNPGGNPDGRSGNHRPEGFLLAAGEGIAAGSEVRNAHILDLAATIFARLDAALPPEFGGTPIQGVARARSG